MIDPNSERVQKLENLYDKLVAYDKSIDNQIVTLAEHYFTFDNKLVSIN